MNVADQINNRWVFLMTMAGHSQSRYAMAEIYLGPEKLRRLEMLLPTPAIPWADIILPVWWAQVNRVFHVPYETVAPMLWNTDPLETLHSQNEHQCRLLVDENQRVDPTDQWHNEIRIAWDDDGRPRVFFTADITIGTSNAYRFTSFGQRIRHPWEAQ